MKHIMLDLETLGKKPGCAILSIGAVQFDFEPEDKQTLPLPMFYTNIDLLSSLFAGFSVDPETLEWWRSQEAETKHGLSLLPRTLSQAITDFDAWVGQVVGDDDLTVWCRGMDFDFPIWEHACASVGKSPPWRYNGKADVRTVTTVHGLAWRVGDPEWKPNAPQGKVGVSHNALDDCLTQIRQVRTAVRGLQPRT